MNFNLIMSISMEQSIGVSGLVSFILRFLGSKMYKIIVLGEKS